VNTDLITWGVQQVEAMCRDLTGRLPQLPALPTVQAQLQVPTTLEVDKQVNDFDFNQLTQVGAGEVFFYDVFVTNNSGGEADGTLTDDLPNEFTLVDVVEGDFNDCNTTDPISCTITGLPDTETDFVSFVMQVPEDWCDDADPVTVVSNTANTFQDMTLTGTDTVLVDVICPELDVEKIVPGGGELESGETFQYQISLTNNSEDPVDATITDELPADFVPGTFLEFGGFDCTLTGQTLDCIVEGLEAGATAIVIINMTVPEDFCSGKEPVPNTVEASQVIEGVEFFADRDTYKVDVLCSDVAIEKSADDDDYFTGEIVTYTLVVINYGPGVAQNITLDDLLPEGLQFLSVSTTQGSCAHQGGGLVHCELGDLGTGRGDVIEITITARITNAAECSEEGTKLKNTAEVAADNEGESLICELDCEELILADSQSSFELSLIGGDKNNSSTAKIFIHCAPNIVITKTAELSGDGTQVTYIITAKNIGTAEATGVVVNDDLDDALTDPQASTTGDGPCVIGSGNTVSCNIGSIPIDGSETVTITAGVPVGVCPARNSAEGAAENEAEGARSDNTDSAGVGGDCVLGTELTRDGVLGLALTGFGMVPLAMMGGLLLLSGATLRRLGRDRRRPWS
jgi:uncharacterized repeat protein (TIGR01451 family)